MTKFVSGSLSALVLSLLSSGCAARSDDATDVAEESVDSAVTGQSEAAVVAELATGVSATTEAEAAVQIGAHASFTPSGCATVTTSGATTTVVLAHCTGRYGLVSIDGTITVRVTAVTPTSVSFTASAPDLEIGGATLALDVSATYRTSGGTTAVEVTSTSTGTGPRGHEVEHTGSYTASWSGTCATVDGAWSSTLDSGLATRALDVSLTRCTTGCPTGTVSRARADGSSISISFDGSATAAWSSSRRGSGTIPLACTP